VHRNHGAHFENHKAAFEEGGGEDDAWFEDESTLSITRNEKQLEAPEVPELGDQKPGSEVAEKEQLGH
jgi:hypothetical protein